MSLSEIEAIEKLIADEKENIEKHERLLKESNDLLNKYKDESDLIDISDVENLKQQLGLNDPPGSCKNLTNWNNKPFEIKEEDEPQWP
jgi:hypothetical protein